MILNLKIVKVNSTTPAVIDKTSFRWPSGDFQIIVPNGYEDAYRNAEGWKEFASYITSEKEMENRPLFEIKDNILVRFNPKEDTDITNIVIPDEVKTIVISTTPKLEQIRFPICRYVRFHIKNTTADYAHFLIHLVGI